MKTALRLLLAPYRFSVDRLFRMGEVGWAHWYDDPNTLYRRRNRLTYSSQSSNAAWVRSGILSVTADADGVGDLVVPTTANSTHAIVQSPVVPGVPAAMTVRAKAGGYNWVAIQLGSTGAAYVNVSTGTAGSTTSGYSISTPVSAGSGYYDFTVSRTDPNLTSAYIFVANADGGASFTGDGTSGVYIARAQLETYTTTPTEYQDVPTTWEQAYLDAVGAERIFAWQDSAGTTPVTAVGQSVGLILDRAYGGRTEESLLANGATGLTGTATAASYSTTTFAGSVSRAGDASNQSWVTWTGLTTSAIHRIRITNTGATSLDVRNGGVAGTIVASIAAGATRYVHPLTSGGSTSITITATANSTTATFTLSQFAAVPGTHRIQASAPSRSLLMARVNLLTYTEQFDNAYWTKQTAGTGTAAVVTANAGTDPLGGSTADRVVFARGAGATTGDYSLLSAGATGIVSGAPYLGAVWMKSNTGATQTVCLYLAANSSAVVSQSVGTTWTRVPVSLTAGATSMNLVFGSRGGAGFTSDQDLDILVWGADLRTADDAAKNIPSYQRVGATAADHDTVGFPHAAYPDGTDDFDTTSTGGGGSAGFFFCGVLTVSGGAGTERTIWSDTGTNTGYRVRINSSNKLELAAGNGSAYTTVQSNETITAPGTYLLSAWDDGGVLAVQVGNAAAATTTRPTVSAGTAAITSYRDNGAATSYFNGRDYGSVYRQSYPGETAHNRLKQWQARRAGITV